MEKYLRDYESLYVRTQKLTDDLEGQVSRNNMLLKEKVDMEKVRQAHPIIIPSCHDDRQPGAYRNMAFFGRK